MSYESPISVTIKVDKEELIEAFEYERNQYEKGRWDMFQTITDAWFGKRYYFLQGEKVYSKMSKKLLTREGAYKRVKE